MQKPVTLVLLLLFFCSCQRKKPVENTVQRTDNYVQPASQDEIDTTQSYISPSDALNDQSPFDPEKFAPQLIRYRGLRKISYEMTSTQAMNNKLTVVVEYLHGTNDGGDSISTASRILLYAKDVLVYRKAFIIEFSSPLQFSASRTFDHIVYTVSPTKAIIYYWLEVLWESGTPKIEYHGICVDNEGVTNELSGDLTKIGSGYASIRFLNETRLKARVPPGARYPYLNIDLIYTIDWKLCNAVLDVPVDTIFSVAEQPSRFFNSRIKLNNSPDRGASFRETNFKKLTQGQMRRIFVPSLFDTGSIKRDHLFIEFNRTTSGWIDYDSMLFEEIISEN
jgi:hypothetical protein